MTIEPPIPWQHLERKPGSLYRQLFIRGRNIAARTLYGQFVNAEEPRTAEQIAADWGVPLEAVREAIAYCESNPAEIRQDWEDEEALDEAMGIKDPEYRKTGRTRRMTTDQASRLGRR